MMSTTIIDKRRYEEEEEEEDYSYDDMEGSDGEDNGSEVDYSSMTEDDVRASIAARIERDDPRPILPDLTTRDRNVLFMINGIYYIIDRNGEVESYTDAKWLPFCPSMRRHPSAVT